MTPNEPPNPAGPAFDQQGQTVHGGQTNIYYGYGESMPANPLSQQQRCDFYQHEQLPPNYIARPELLAEIRDALLQTEANLALTSSLRRTDALFGMGGIGKTVVARALCDDPEIQAAFPNGILWATLGQTPDLAARLRDWISALGGAVPPTALTPEALTNILAQTLSDRRCLLIVDDVWQRAHLKYFLVTAQDSRLLFTTRNADIATEVKATIRPIPVMARNEAIALLIEWAGEAIINTHHSLQQAIVERLGRLPLAIKLAGDQLRRHEPTAWLATFDAHKLGKRRPQDLHDSLETTFALSLADLTAEERRLFNALSIFPDDELIPLCAIAKLWAALAGYAEAGTVDLLHFLADRALLQLAPAPQLPKLTDHAQITVTFHDLIRDFMAAELGVAGLHTGHLALLAAYRQTQHAAGWHSAPNDGYLYDHLVYHLTAIVNRDPTALAELLALFATPAWLQVRVPAADYRYAGYLRDLDQTWTVYRTSSPADTAVDLAQTLPTHLRFALLRTSINSLTANYGPMLVGYAVALGLWSKARALSIFSQTTDPLHKAQVGCALLTMGQLPKPEQATVLHHSLAVVNALTPPDTQLRTLIALAHHQQGEERAQLLYDLLRVTTALPAAWQQVRAFTAFAHLLRPQHHPPALNWIGQLTELYDQIEAALHLLIHAKEASLETRQVIGALLTKDDTSIHFIIAFHRMTYLCPLADERYALILQIYLERATPEQVDAFLDKFATLLDSLRKELFFQQVQKAALAIQAAEHRALILSLLICYLKFNQQEQLFPQILAAVFAILDKRLQANVLSELTVRISNKSTVHSSWATLFTIPDELQVDILKALVPHLPGEQREQAMQQALTTANTMEYEDWRAEMLVALVPHLLGEQREQAVQQALTVVNTIEYEGWRAEMLIALVPHIHSEQAMQQALTTANTFRNGKRRAEMLVALVPHLLGEQQGQAVQQALIAANTIWNGKWRAEILVALTAHLHSEQAVQQALIAASNIEDEGWRAEVLVALTAHLHSEQAVQQALIAANTFHNESWRAEVLVALTAHLHSEQAVQQALIAANTFRNEKRQAEVLVALTTYLHSEQAVQQALIAANTMEDEEWRTEVLVALVPHLLGEQQGQAVQQALIAANTMEDEEWRAEVLVALFPHLPGEQQEQAVQQLLTMANTMEDEEWRAEVLVALAPQLYSTQAMQQALAAANNIKYEDWRAEVLIAFVAHFCGEQQEQAVQQLLTAANNIRHEGWRTKVLVTLVPHLHNVQAVQQALTAANTIWNKGWRAEVLVALVPHLSGEQREQAVQQVLTAASTIEDESWRAGISALFTLHLSRAQQEQAFYQALLSTVVIEDRKSRTNSTPWLISHLPPEIKEIVLVRFLQTNFTHIDPTKRTDVLLRLLPYLTELPVAHYCRVLKSIDDEWLRAVLIDYTLPSLTEDAHATIADLLPYLSDPLNCARIAARLTAQPTMATVETQLQAAVAISDEQQRVKFYLTLRKALPPQQQTAVNTILAQALSLLDQPTDVVTAQLFLAAAPDHTQRTDLLTTLLSFAARIVEPGERIATLVSLLPDLEPVEQAAVIEHALNATQKINAPQQRVAALLPLLPRLASRLRAATVRQLYQDIFTITDAATRARAFATLLPYLDDDLRLPALQRAITAVQQIAAPLDRIAILTQIAETGDRPATELAYAAALARAIELAHAVALTLTEHGALALAIHLFLPVINEAEKATLLQQGLQVAWTLPSSLERATALANYLPYVSDVAPIHKELLRVVIETIHARAQDATRAALLDHLATDPLLQLVPLSAEIRLALAHTTAEICNEWNWL